MDTQRDGLRSALRAAQVTYDRTGSIQSAHYAAATECRAAGYGYAESERIARWTLRQIRTHYSP